METNKLRSFFLEEYAPSVLVMKKICLPMILLNCIFITSLFFRHRMSHQQLLINGTVPNGNTLQTLQHYLVNNNLPSTSSDLHNQNVHVRIVKQEQAQQSYIINRQYIQQTPNVQVQAIPQHLPEIYWLLVEIESNNGLNSYALVESKDVVGQPMLESLNTGKLVIVIITGKQTRATVVMASRKFKVLKMLNYF